MHSESIGALAKALSEAQGEMTHASKDAENPAFKRGNKASTYADLSNVIEAIRLPLSKHGLSYVQAMKPHETMAVVETTLMHASGEWISSEVALPVAAKTPHGYGSAFTYARRYSLAAIVGIAQADDDGNAGSAVAPEVHKGSTADEITRSMDAPAGAGASADAAELYEKAAILGGYRSQSAQAIVTEFSEFKGKSITSPEHARNYLSGKPDGKWVSMTTRKIEDAISSHAAPKAEEMPEWAQ